MKAHDLARALLAGPNVEVAAAFDAASDYATQLSFSGVEGRYELVEEGDGYAEKKTDVVILAYHRDSPTYSVERP